MRWLLSALLLVTVACASAPPADGPAAVAPRDDTGAKRFSYDPERGECRDAAGNTGYNTLPLATLIASGDAECADLSGRDLYEEAMQQGLSTGFQLTNLRGANLQNTGFPPYNAPKVGTPLQGADIRGAYDVYGMPLGGTIDAHTRYDDDCVVAGLSDDIECPPKTR